MQIHLRRPLFRADCGAVTGLRPACYESVTAIPAFSRVRGSGADTVAGVDWQAQLPRVARFPSGEVVPEFVGTEVAVLRRESAVWQARVVRQDKEEDRC